MTRTLVNLHPLAEFKQMVESMDRAFDTLWGEASSAANLPQIPVDIYEKDGSVYISAAVPGIAPEDIDISVEQHVLTIRGEVRRDWESSEAKVYRREQRFGQFVRSISLPEDLDVEGIDAEFSNGVVTMRIPRIEPPKPETRKVSIRNAESRQPVLQQKADQKATNGRQERETAAAQ